MLLSQYYIEHNELRSALTILNKFPGTPSSTFLYQKLSCLNRMSDFEGVTKELPSLKKRIDEGDEYCVAVFLKWIGFDNQTVFKASKNYQKKFEGKQDFTFRGSLDKGRKIRLAYIGSNFVPHAQALQFGHSFFKEHGDKFEVFIYSLKGDGTTLTEKAFKEEVNHFVEAESLSNDALIELIRKDEIDIIVNCNGHADERRPYQILCRRVAPIQIDFLGYPGTSGATYIDYYIGDPVSTPIDKLGRFFTEKLILLPYTYQVTEHREVYPTLPTNKLSPQKAREIVLHLLQLKKESYRSVIIDFLKKGITDEVRKVYHHAEKGDAPFASFEDQLRFLQNVKSMEESDRAILQGCVELFDHLSRFAVGDPEADKEMHPLYVNYAFPSEEWVAGRFIFCSLNNHVKLSLEDIQCWNEILLSVKNSVLILFLVFSYEPQENLIKLFDPEVRERLYFIGSIPKSSYASSSGMDLILDSFHWGAHTSAGDAIWAGVPLSPALGRRWNLGSAAAC